MLVRCRKCGHQFDYAGSLEVPAGLLLQCPQCRQLTAVRVEAPSGAPLGRSSEEETDHRAGFGMSLSDPVLPSASEDAAEDETPTEERLEERSAPLPPVEGDFRLSFALRSAPALVHGRRSAVHEEHSICDVPLPSRPEEIAAYLAKPPAPFGEPTAAAGRRADPFVESGEAEAASRGPEGAIGTAAASPRAILWTPRTGIPANLLAPPVTSESLGVDPDDDGNQLADLPVPKGPVPSHQRPLGLAIGPEDSGDVDLPVPKRAFESVSWRESTPPPSELPAAKPPAVPLPAAAPAERVTAAASGAASAPAVQVGALVSPPATPQDGSGGGAGPAAASAQARGSGDTVPPPVQPAVSSAEQAASPTSPSVVPQGARVTSRRRVWLAAGALVLVALAGVWFQLRSKARGPALVPGASLDAAALDKARRLLSEGSIAAYREAVAALQPLPVPDPKDPEGPEGPKGPNDAAARGLVAQAHFAAVLLGLGKEAEAKEIGQAQAVLASLGRETKGAKDAFEVQKARALELLFMEKMDEAAKMLQALRGEAPRDAAVWVYLGWKDLALPDLKAAQADFNQALGLESERADALLGLGRTRERMGDLEGARTAYQSVLRRHPHHPGAEIGMLSLAEVDPARAARKLDEFQARSGEADRPAVLLGEAWATVGRRALGEGRQDEAEGYFRRALQVDARSAEGAVGLAQALVQSGMTGAAQAVPLLEGVIARRPRYLEARLAVVEACIRSGRIDAAQKALERVAELAPGLPVLHLWRGRLAELRRGPGAEERAVRDYQAAIAGASHLTPAYLALAQLWRRMGRVAEGEALLAQIEQRAAGDSALADELGRGYLMMGETRRAEALFRKASEGARIGPRLHLAEALVLLQRLDEASQVLDELGRTDPMLPGLAARRAELAMQRHRFDEAANHYAQALDSALGAPSHSLRIAAGEIFFKVGKLEPARAVFQAAVKDDERDALAQFGLAQTDFALGRFADAIPEARRAGVLGAGAKAPLLAAQAGERLGQLDQALADYQAAMDASASGMEARMGRARLLLRRGAAKDCIADLNYVLQREPQRVEAQILLGDAYEVLGQRSRAYAAYQLAARPGHDPRSAEAAFKLGRLLKAEGKLKVAIPALERAIELDGERGPFSAEAYLLLGEAHRALVRPGKPEPDRALAIQAYQKYLELTPRIDAPMRRDAERALQLLEAPPP